MKVQIIIGSVRPGRVGPQIAHWVNDNLPKDAGIDYEIVDIADWKLPLFDEPIHPSKSDYQHDHTKAWSAKIKQADGYILVTPEYNAGYPASFKNAIDYLYHEWRDKPVMIASYGVAGGTRSSAQLRQVAEQLKMRPTEVSPAFTISQDMYGEDGQIKDIATSFEPYISTVKTAAEQLHDLLEVAETTVA